MSTVIKRPLYRNRETVRRSAAELRHAGEVRSRRRTPVWRPVDDDEGRFLARCVAGILLIAVAPLLAFVLAHHLFPGILLIDITPGITRGLSLLL